MATAGLSILFHGVIEVSKGAKIRNRYNQVPHLTQDTNGEVTNSQQNAKDMLSLNERLPIKWSDKIRRNLYFFQEKVVRSALELATKVLITYTK